MKHSFFCPTCSSHSLHFVLFYPWDFASICLLCSNPVSENLSEYDRELFQSFITNTVSSHMQNTLHIQHMILGQQGQATPVPSSAFSGGHRRKTWHTQTPWSIALLLSELTSSPSLDAHSTRSVTHCLHVFVHACPPGPCNVFLEQLSPPLIGAGERFPDLLLCVERPRLRPCHTELAVGTCNSILFRAVFFGDNTVQPECRFHVSAYTVHFPPRPGPFLFGCVWY